MDLVRTPFDNNRTLLYKWAYSQEVPVRLVVILKRPPGVDIGDLEPDEQIFETLRDRVDRMSMQETALLGQDPREPGVYVAVKEGIQNNLKDLDILMTWYEMMLDQGHDPAELIDELNEWNKIRIGKELYSDVGKLLSSHESWLDQIERSLIKDTNYTQDIILPVENVLNQFEPVKLTNITVKSSTLTLSAKNKNGTEITSEDSTDIFNESRVTPEVPFISYLENEDLEKYLNKIYISPSEQSSDLDHLIIRRGVLKGENTMYLNVYKFLGSNNLSKIQPKNFTISTLNLNSRELSIDSTPETEKTLLSRVRSSLPNVTLSGMKETYITGTFYVFGVDLFLPSFLDMLLLQELFRLYLYVDEVAQPQAIKKRLNIKYKSGAFVDSEESENKVEDRFSISIRSVIADQNETYTLLDSEDGKPKIYTVKPQESYLAMTISRASNHEIIQEFLRIFRYLLGAYQATRGPADRLYSSLFPSLVQRPEPISPIRSKSLQGIESGEESEIEESEIEEGTEIEIEKKRLDQLSSDAPQIFKNISNYGTKCQSRAQPFVLPDEEVPEWTSQTFSYKGQTYNRQALPFPPRVTTGAQQLPEQYFACDSPEYPFPGIRAVPRKKGDPETELPYVPCCYQADQMDPNNTKSDYNAYYQNYEKPSSRATSKLTSRILGKRAILPAYRLGYIPFDLANVLKKYLPDTEWKDENRHMARMGVITSSPSSFLHCVCEAVSDPDYIKLPSEKEGSDARERYVRILRKNLAKRVPLHVVRQELWDLSDQEILDRLNDPEFFLDPSLFYRLIEEYFNINVYTFGFVDDAITRIEIPRHKVFHSTVYRPERPTILIMKHRGTVRETKIIPQCELIVDVNNKTFVAVKIFPVEMTSIVNTIFTLNNNVVTFSFDSMLKLIGRDRLYHRADFRQLVKGGSSCWIDAYGKMRAITFLHNNKPMTLVGIPSQPENLPLIPSVDQLPNATFKDTLEVFGDPVGVTKDSIGQIIGLWYPIFDLRFGVYIPVMRDLADPEDLMQRLQQLPAGPPPPLNVASGPALERLRYLRKLASIIQQLAEYVFDVYRRNKMEAREPIYVSNFIDAYFGSANKTGDPLEFYNIRNLPRVLPDEISVETAIFKMSQLMPKFFTRDKFVLYNQELLRKVSIYVASYYKETEGLYLDPKSKLNIFLDEEDFIQTKNSNVFLTEKDLLLWIGSQKIVSVNLTLLSKLDPNRAQTLTPYLYQHTNGQIYLVQNVILGSLKRALKVSKNWFERKINLGPGRLGEEIDDKDIAIYHVVYGISPSGTLAVIQDETGGNQPYLEVIYYGTNIEEDTAPRYGALLPFLK